MARTTLTRRRSRSGNDNLRELLGQVRRGGVLLTDPGGRVHVRPFTQPGQFLGGDGNFGTPPSYTDEQAQDAVGSILVDSATIDFTYDDPGPSITAIVKDGSITPAKLSTEAKRYSVWAEFDGGTSAIVAADAPIVYVRVPVAFTIEGWEIVADVSGSIVVDVWKDTYANYPPTVADTIAGSEKPTLSSAIKNQDLSLSTWTTSVSVGDYLAFKVDSASTVKWVRVTLIGSRA